ncbi:MAG: 4Fe-4S dicluster domain-containing protein [Candidatus Coatesbacteria bacterium]|nr:4Fe-4S dicluster domain-containing protein [Candidatus Coatesbacteria bacterium]
MLPACTYIINEDVEVFTESEKTRNARKRMLSNLLSFFPNVPYLRKLADDFGIIPDIDESKVKSKKTDACILCERCVRVCKESVWENILEFEGVGYNRRVVMSEEKAAFCVGCATCAYVCPTGAIKVTDEFNNPVDPLRIRKYGMRLNTEVFRYDDQQCQMRRSGTAHLVEIMDAYDLLPTHNYKFGKHELTPQISSNIWIEKFVKQNVPDGCWNGCMMACAKGISDFILETGPYKGEKVLVDGPEYETAAGCGSNIGVFNPHVIAEINFYCDTYGIDTISFGTALAFVMECYEAGILNKEITGGLELKFGAEKESLEILHQMAEGRGFGVIVGKGIRRMKKIFAEEYGGDPKFLHDIGMESKGMEYSEYMTKESLAMQGGYAMALKGAQHDEAWLIFMDMVNNQIPTFEMKAEALHYFPMFRTWFGLMGLCKLLWNDIEPIDNAKTKEPAKVPGHVEGYCNYFAGMTGIEITPAELILQSERVYNFQRVFNLRLGFGTREHDRGPYRAMGPVTIEEYESRQERYDTQLKEKVGVDPDGKSSAEKLAILRAFREDQYEKLLDAVYIRRGWTNDGIPKISKMRELGMDFPDVIEIIKQAGVNE